MLSVISKQLVSRLDPSGEINISKFGVWMLSVVRS